MKESKSINDEYSQEFTAIFYHLSLPGKLYDHEDHIGFILGGLPEKYQIVADQIEGPNIPPSLIEIHVKLHNREATIQTTATAITLAPVTANAADSRGSNNNNSNNCQHNNIRNNQTWHKNQFTPCNHQNAPCGYQGKSQIYGVFGHTTRRFSQLELPQCDYPKLISSETSSYDPWKSRVNVAVAPYNAANKLLDSGVTHHLTSDLNNLALH